MSSELAILRRELRSLQVEVGLLRERVDRQAERIEELESERGYLVVDRASSAGVPSRDPGDAPSVTCTPPSKDLPFDEDEADWNLRARIAKEIGIWLKRSLDGERVGASPRSLIEHKSRIYILIRDIKGNLFTKPARIFRTWGSLKPHVEAGGSFGDSIFIGVPSQKEALIAVTEGGFSWPSSVEG